MTTKTSKFASASSQLPALTLGPGQLFIQSQLCTKPQYPPADLDLSGQTAIVTGANSGIGFACAKLLLQHKLSHLIITVRSKVKGDVAAKELYDAAASEDSQIYVWELDMGSYSSIADFAKRCGSLHQIDFVILNAGMGRTTFHINKETGHEETMQVNFLSTMYLSVLLLPVLKNKAASQKPGRLTIVNSGTAMHCELPEAKEKHIISAFDSEFNFDGLANYGKSKLLGQLFIDKLARHIDSNDVVINCLNPGLTKATGLMDKSTGLQKVVLSWVARIVGFSPERAAATYVDAAVIKGKETHGSYIMNWEISPFGAYYYSEGRQELQDRIWNEVMDEFAFANMQGMIESMER
ncbi:hypothetical protein F53441_1255 [Fusarium austroafricanum]|uniref:Short-chain dehydrogenase/reductase family protein n=1 Tax=Fusarium austroafricanum TaxID=2364996 RepID=A0A8H4KW19_9HYPO|nr:hypothetical protein F53441_1255 [Fusarium austroafricanum]